MTTCTSCGTEVTGKKFCHECGTPVQPTVAPIASGQPSTCPRCSGDINPGSAFCMHCGSSLHTLAQAATATPPPPSAHPCPACHTEVPVESAFCTNCGQNTHASVAPVAAATPTFSFCTNCGQHNAPGVHFCNTCGTSLIAATAAVNQAPTAPPPPLGQPPYQQSPYPQQPYAQTQYPQQPQQYGQSPYPQQQYAQPQYPQQPQQYGQSPYPQQQYGQPQYPQQYGQMGYQPEPMLGQQPMALRCPVCMAMAQMGTANCPGCHTSLAGIVPTPAYVPAQGQQGGLGGFLQGSGGKMAIGALGGAAAVIGGELLLHEIEGHHHQQYGNDGNPLGGGGLGEIARDIGLL